MTPDTILLGLGVMFAAGLCILSAMAERRAIKEDAKRSKVMRQLNDAIANGHKSNNKPKLKPKR